MGSCSSFDTHGNNGGEMVKHLSIDEVLTKWVGEFGRAQITHFVLTSLAWSLEALHTLVTIFADRPPSWRCTHIQNHYDNHASQYNYNHTSFDSGLTSDRSSNFRYGASVPADYVCKPSSSICDLAPGVWEWVHKQESTLSEWNLVCGSTYMQSLAMSFFFIGYLLGAGLCGHLSDSKLGRRGALALTCMLNAVCGMLTAASPNYGMYTLLRTATGICSGGLGLTSFVLGTEVIGPSRRTFASMSALYFYPLGMLVLASMAACTSPYSWRILYLVTSIPSVLYCIVILPFLAESPRWYLVRGRADEALQVLRSIAEKNGTTVPDGIILCMENQDSRPHLIQKEPEDGEPLPMLHSNMPDLTHTEIELRRYDKSVKQGQHKKEAAPYTIETMPPHSFTIKQKEHIQSALAEILTLSPDCRLAETVPNVDSNKASGTLMDVFRSKDTRVRMLILVVVWFASALGYYAFNLNVGNLGTNLTMTVVLNALAEIPGYALTTCLLNRAGRRITVIGALFFSASSSLLSAVISLALNTQTSPTFSSLHSLAQNLRTSKAQGLRSLIQLICSLVGLSSIAGTFNLLYLYTAELFPTIVRNAAIGLATQAGTIGSIIAPIVVFSAHVNTALPFFIIGVSALLSGMLSLKLPETLNSKLHETFAGMRRAKNGSF